MTLKIQILTLYPEIFPGSLKYGIIGNALKQNKWNLEVIDIRNFATDKHHSVDDTPAGGGAGMVMRADVLAKAIDSCDIDAYRIVMSPRGQVFNQDLASKFSQEKKLLIICGRFEGLDERIIKKRQLKEISLGDFILSGGEVAALAMLESIIRLLPGTMGNMQSATEESFSENLLEYPQYTRPRIFEDESIPEVLLNGNHEAIKKWRREQSELLTKQRRYDLWEKYIKNIQKKHIQK